MCQPIRVQGSHIEFRIDLRSNNTWLEPHREHLCQLRSKYLPSILENKFKMCWPIRGRGGHIGFQIDLKCNNT